jgi:hypothetical protein
LLWLGVGGCQRYPAMPQTTSILKFATISTFHYFSSNVSIHHPGMTSKISLKNRYFPVL